jgi:hypothetical protein
LEYWADGKRRNELQNCSNALGHIAHEVNLSTFNLYIIAAKRPALADPLKQAVNKVLDLNQLIYPPFAPSSRPV